MQERFYWGQMRKSYEQQGKGRVYGREAYPLWRVGCDWCSTFCRGDNLTEFTGDDMMEFRGRDVPIHHILECSEERMAADLARIKIQHCPL